MPKRKADEAGLPSKIMQTPASGNGTGPFVVYFPSRFEPSGDVACEWQAYAHSERRNQHVVVARTNNKVDFVGSTSNPEYASAPPCRYALGLFSRSAGNLELMPAEGGKILRLEPRVHGQSYGPSGTTTEIEAGGLRQANTRLVDSFGSQRRKRQLKQREAGKVEAGHVSAGQAVLGLIAGAGAAAGDTKEEVIKRSLAQRNIPPHHPEAATAVEAYRSEDIVPPAIRDALEITRLFPAENKPEYRATLKAMGTFGEGYVLSRLQLLSLGDQDAREERCRMLVLLGHLLKLQSAKNGVLKAGAGGIEELGEKLKMAPSVLEGLLDLFYSEEPGFEGRRSFILSNEKRNLMINWALILAVRVELNCVLEVESFQALAAELKSKPGDLILRYREMGCVDVATTLTSPEGTRTRGHRITLMPPSAEEGKTLGDYFPALKLGAKRR